jgi:hypothetical protein
MFSKILWLVSVMRSDILLFSKHTIAIVSSF